MSNGYTYKIHNNKTEIQYDLYEITHDKNALEKEVLKNYVVRIPTSSGAGHVFSEIQRMALLTKQIYEEVENLIKATAETLESIGINIAEMDNSIAEMFDEK